MFKMMVFKQKTLKTTTILNVYKCSTDYESVGRGFESLSAYHVKSPESKDSGLFSDF